MIRPFGRTPISPNRVPGPSNSKTPCGMKSSPQPKTCMASRSRLYPKPISRCQAANPSSSRYGMSWKQDADSPSFLASPSNACRSRKPAVPMPGSAAIWVDPSCRSERPSGWSTSATSDANTARAHENIAGRHSCPSIRTGPRASRKCGLSAIASGPIECRLSCAATDTTVRATIRRINLRSQRNQSPFNFNKNLIDCRYNRNNGVWAARDGAVLTKVDPAAFYLIDTTVAEPGFALSMNLRKGDLQIVNNFTVLHSRTKYTDAAERKRHLLRLWLHNPDARRNGHRLVELFALPHSRFSDTPWRTA